MTSLPVNSNNTLRKTESDGCILGYDDWFNMYTTSLYKSEDGLSTLSSDYDKCPEIELVTSVIRSSWQNGDDDSPSRLRNCDSTDSSDSVNYEIIGESMLPGSNDLIDGLEINMASNSNTFLSNKTNNISGSPNQNTSKNVSHKSRRHGSATVRELTAHFYRLNWKLHSSKVSDILGIKTPIVYKRPIYLLGKKYFYDKNPQAGSSAPQSNWLGDSIMLNRIDGGKKEFLLDFHSRFWMTYRQDFKRLPCPIINPSPSSSHSNCNLPSSSQVIGCEYNSSNNSPNSLDDVFHVPSTLRTSDCGWGCMLRSGQMILAQALCMHFLGRNWTIDSKHPRDKAFEQQIIKWFGDTPKVTSPYSIHRLVAVSNHLPGEWFGPHSISVNLKKVFYDSKALEPKLRSLEMYLAQDRIIYRKEILNLIREDINSDDNYVKDSQPSNRGVILMITIQLGADKCMRSMYNGALHRWLQDPTCLGVIGGKPKHSVYVIGYQDNNAVCLDPHFPQKTLDMEQPTVPSDSYHCAIPWMIPFSELDPSCAVGFYCRGEVELTGLLDRLQKISSVYERPNKKMSANMTHSRSAPIIRPIIEVVDGDPPEPLRFMRECTNKDCDLTNSFIDLY